MLQDESRLLFMWLLLVHAQEEVLFRASLGISKLSIASVWFPHIFSMTYYWQLSQPLQIQWHPVSNSAHILFSYYFG